MAQAFLQAARQVWRRRSESAAVIAIMAVSIGSCVAIFSIVKAVWLDDWGYANTHRMAIVWHARQGLPGVVGMSPSDVQSHRTTLTSAAMLGAVSTRGVNLGTDATATRITCARMTHEMFPMLGVSPSRGRWTIPEDERASDRVVVLSAALARQLTGSLDAVDRPVSLDGVVHRVVGVMPESFAFPPEGVQGLTTADCWLPVRFTAMELAVPSFNFVLFASMKPEATLAQMSAEAHAGAQRIWSTYPAAVQSQVQLTALAVPLTEQVLARSRMPLMLFAGAVIGLLLIGCANVSNLMMTAFESRQTELSVRSSLGAPRWMVVMQLVVESILLSVAGSLVGLVIAAGLLSGMIAANAAAFPRLAAARVDMAALGVALVCGIVAGVAGALWPALGSSKTGGQLQPSGARSVARGFAGTLSRRGLIAFELALAVIVLILAGVLSRSVSRLNDIQPGFNPDRLVTFSLALPETRYQARDQILLFSTELIRRLEALPGVEHAAVSTSPPIGEATASVVFSTDATAGAPEYKPALVHAVSADYLPALGLVLRSGRFVDVADSPAGMPVAVLNESLARTLFPDGRAMGRSFSRIGSAKPLTVVGIVADTRQAGPLRPAVPAFYVPLSQNDQPVRSLHIALRADMSLRREMPTIRRTLADLDAEVPPFAVKTGAELVNGTIAIQRFNMVVLGVFACFALLLAISGLYAVLAQSVQQSRREFGIRQALGATRGDVIRSVVARALMPAVIGVLVGGVAALAASKLIASQLFGVAPNDPATFAAVGVMVVATSTLVVAGPARRASRLDFSTLLRHDG